MPNSSEILGQLQTFQSNRRKPQDVINEQEQRLGVSGVRERQAGLRGAIMNTENLLRAVDPSVSGRTQGSLVTEAQRTKMVANERAPIAEQFTEQSRALENESANLEGLTRQASTAAQLALSQDDQQQNYLQGLYSSLYQQEKDERDRQEQIRQFNAAQAFEREKIAANERASRAAGGLYGLGGGSTAQSSARPQTDPAQQLAYNAVRDLLNTKNTNVIKNTFNAIQKSAGYGNSYDKMKLEMLGQLRPDLFSGRNMTNAIANANQLRF